MTLLERLRAAAVADRLSDWVRVSRDGVVSWRLPQESDAGPDGIIRPLLRVKKAGKWLCPDLGVRKEGTIWTIYPLGDNRDAAIRAGLIALAEREEGLKNEA